MSTATITSPPAPTVSAPPDRTQGVTFPRVVRSEWIKFRSLRSSWYMLLAAVAALPVLGFVVAYNTRNLNGVAAEDAVPSAVLQGYLLAELLVGVLGVLVVSGEYGTGMIRSTVGAVPGRVPVVLAKAVVLGTVTLLPLAVTSLATFLGAQAFLSRYHPGFSLSDPGALRVVLGTAAYLALIGLLGGAIGWILRSTAGGIAALLALVLVVPVLFGGLLGNWGKDVAQFLPSNAGEAFIQSLSGDHMLAAWTGLGVLVAWVVAGLAVAAVQLRRRDV